MTGIEIGIAILVTLGILVGVRVAFAAIWAITHR